MDLDSNLVHKNAPEELDKNAAIMTLRLVNYEWTMYYTI